MMETVTRRLMIIGPPPKFHGLRDILPVPAKNFWSVIVYDLWTRSTLAHGQRYPMPLFPAGSEDDRLNETVRERSDGVTARRRDVDGPGSTASRVFSDSSACTRARSTASSACGEPGRAEAGRGAPAVPAGSLEVVLAVDALPRVATQSFRVLRVIPRSAAIPRNVAPGVDSYNSTACHRNSSE